MIAYGHCERWWFFHGDVKNCQKACRSCPIFWCQLGVTIQTSMIFANVHQKKFDRPSSVAYPWSFVVITRNQRKNLPIFSIGFSMFFLYHKWHQSSTRCEIECFEAQVSFWLWATHSPIPSFRRAGVQWDLPDRPCLHGGCAERFDIFEFGAIGAPKSPCLLGGLSTILSHGCFVFVFSPLYYFVT